MNVNLMFSNEQRVHLCMHIWLLKELHPSDCFQLIFGRI